MVSAIINRPALGSFPSGEWADILETGLLKAAPKGMDQIFTAMTGSDANETAYKAAFIWRRAQERGLNDFTQEELDSTMLNKAPGSPEYSILSFHKGFHGRTFGSLSTTRSKAIHKLDIPAFDWPAAPFPQLKYPLDQYAAENAAEEERCLQETEKLISSFHNPVVAVVVEPIQSEGGDNHASPEFFRRLQDITKRNGVLLIVDEVQTGVGATGKFWAHEHWGLESPPDIVTFSKKAQAAGFYFSDPELRPSKPYRQYNTWMGDPARALLFRGIYNEIERLGLVQRTAEVGKYLYAKLEELAGKYPNEIQNLRGKDRGTFIAWDSPRRDEVIRTAKTKGLNIGGSGENTIRLRPMLVFEESHGMLQSETFMSRANSHSRHFVGDSGVDTAKVEMGRHVVLQDHLKDLIVRIDAKSSLVVPIHYFTFNNLMPISPMDTRPPRAPRSCSGAGPPPELHRGAQLMQRGPTRPHRGVKATLLSRA